MSGGDDGRGAAGARRRKLWDQSPADERATEPRHWSGQTLAGASRSIDAINGGTWRAAVSERMGQQ